MKTVKVKPQWMVLSRHFFMPGGLLDYGEATIEEFFDSFEEADKYAKKKYESMKKVFIHPIVWVLRCEKTYREGGIVISKEESK